MSSLSDDYRLPPEFSYHGYAFFSGLFDRYTDFFEPNTKMRYFQSNFTLVEQMLERIEELDPMDYDEVNYELLKHKTEIISTAMRRFHTMVSDLLCGLE